MAPLSENAEVLVTSLERWSRYDRSYGRLVSGVISGLRDRSLLVGPETNGRFWTLKSSRSDTTWIFDSQSGLTKQID